MILLWASNEPTIRVAEILAKSCYPEREIQCDNQKYFRGHDFTILTIMDLSADGTFQELMEPKAYAEDLIKKGLPESVTRICLLVSDTQFKKSLAAFSKSLAVALGNKGRTIKVHYVSKLNADYTLIVPPVNPTDDWSVFAIYDKDAASKLNIGCASFFKQEQFVSDILKHKTLDIEELKKIEKKVLLWQGKDIEAWCNHPQRTALPLDSQIKQIEAKTNSLTRP
jgi:hypothetical protein